jgi:hypothetical protein
MTTKKINEWSGGKPAGCISKRLDGYQILISIGPRADKRNITKWFSFSQYENEEKTYEVAKKWQYEESNNLGITKNMYRYVTNDNEKYIEVKLQRSELIMKCEIEHLPIIEKRIWYGWKGKDRYTYYGKCRPSQKRNYEAALFHNLAYPELKQVDHVNRDGLDNRKSNIREGNGRINANNKRLQKNNKSGIKGVYRENGKKPRWVAQWVDKNCKRCKKSFSINKFGEEEAKKLAIEHRIIQQNQTNEHIFIENVNNIVNI